MISVSGKYTECKPLFIEERDVAIVASGSVLQLLASQTGDLIGSLRGHKTNVSSLIRHHTMNNHVIYICVLFYFVSYFVGHFH